MRIRFTGQDGREWSFREEDRIGDASWMGNVFTGQGEDGSKVAIKRVAVVPVAGILIGGAMTATSLAGKRVMEDLTKRRGEYEALLALGFLAPDAVRELCRPSLRHALIPALDQTRTVGLVTLPGAFVGVLLGGGGPIQAGATQLLVLIGLLAVETIAVIVVTELIAHDVIRRPAGTDR